MSDNIDEMTPAARWKHLQDNGKDTLVDLSSNDLVSDKPSWFDEERFARARKLVNKYYLGINFSSLTGLLLLLQLPDVLESLLVTGNSKDVPSLFRRYLSTILHVRSWYKDDIFDPKTKGYKSIRLVRSMHKRIQHLMNDKFKVNDLNDKPRLWMTQYDVALTQFAFIGLAMLYPKKCALISASNEDLELLNYYWRVLGWLMGVKDEYNACQFDNYEDIYEYNRIMFKEGYLDVYNDYPCDMGIQMDKAICIALHYYLPLVTFNSLAHWWKDCFEFNGYQRQPLNRKEKMLHSVTKISFNNIFKHKGYLKMFTQLHEIQFVARLKRKEKIHDDLKNRYQGCPHMSFLSDRVKYFDAQKDPIDADEKKLRLADEQHHEIIPSKNEKNDHFDDEISKTNAAHSDMIKNPLKGYSISVCEKILQ